MARGEGSQADSSSPDLDPVKSQWPIIERVVQEYRGKKGAIIPVLQEVQAILGYVPEIAMDYIAQELGVTPSAIYGVVTFYAQFYLEPRGKYIIRTCRGTACHVKGGKAVLKAIQDKLGIADGETTPDLTFTLETVACLGACALAPVVVVNKTYYGNMNPQKVLHILEQYEKSK
ncbi:MAG: NADH-quinone oxidoreductase subunit NuoE [bacterium]